MTEPEHVAGSRNTAIVIGASVAGLLAARVLSPHFRRVVLLERDLLPADPSHRKGAPQSQHAHGLLAEGRQILERLFPGITDALLTRGARLADITRDVIWHVQGNPHARFASGICGLLASRPLLENELRTRVLALPNVTIETGVDVTELVTDRDRSRITGVRLAARTLAAREVHRAADLVVDASGRGSRLPLWLDLLGLPLPAEESVAANLQYSTVVLRRQRGQIGGALGVVCPSSPQRRRGAVALAMEGDRWILTLSSTSVGQPPPLDAAGMLDYARSLPATQLAELLAGSEALGAAQPYRFTHSQRRRFEQLRHPPAGLIAFGDSLCSFNPVFGQGMTCAAQQAQVLEQALMRSDLSLPYRFYGEVARTIDRPWQIVTGADARLHDIADRNTPANRAIQAYLDRVHRAAHSDATVAMAFQRVANLMAPPASLLDGKMAWRVLRGNLLPQPVARGAVVERA
jgi:2-polyprenyl-6-methoxyphenol hydroxylase-like FAD-dependent oxidoreductase